MKTPVLPHELHTHYYRVRNGVVKFAKKVFEKAEKDLDSLKKEAVHDMKEKEDKVKGHIEKLDAFIKEHELNDAKEIEFSEKISGEKKAS